MSANPLRRTRRLAPTASQDELRRAFRRALRASYPRHRPATSAVRPPLPAGPWEQVGVPASQICVRRGPRPSPRARRRSRDGGRHRIRQGPPKARAYGHPGGRWREQYLGMIHRWAGPRAFELEKPYDPALVRSAPREDPPHARRPRSRRRSDRAHCRAARHQLDHPARRHLPEPPGRKVDHVDAGARPELFAFMSGGLQGGPVRARKGELIGEAVAGERPCASSPSGVRALTAPPRCRFPTTRHRAAADDAHSRRPSASTSAASAQLGEVAVRQSALSTPSSEA